MQREDSTSPIKVLNQVFRQYKLVSVSLKEAALDSPSFRANANHMDAQLLQTEKWFTALVASFSKLPKQVKQLQSFFNSCLEFLVPLFLQEGIVDQEYTSAAFLTSKDGMSHLWLFAFNVLLFDTTGIEMTKNECLSRIEEYKKIRRRFDAAQEKYDNFLLIHMATPKSKEARLILEDLLQLAEARKTYIQLCLDLVQEFSDLTRLMNGELIKMNFTLWRERIEKIGSSPFATALLQDLWTTAKRVEAWSESYQHAMGNMSEDFAVAKKNVLERTVGGYTPSTELNDYRTLLINNRVLSDCDETAVEKHGYLFMKTWRRDKANKPFWVRRWVFVQGGVLGFLVLSPSQTSVQETDKIGVLLCNVKYAPNEERRFCLEVKTIDTTIILQAETLRELKLWIKVFDNAKSKIVAEDSPMHNLFHIASGRYPPIVTEFLSSVNTALDRELTSARVITAGGQIVTSSKLSTHLERNEKFFERHIFHQVGRISLPFSTDTTRSSLIAYSLAGSTAVPTALSANIWGSINWGGYYLYDATLGDLQEALELPEEKLTKQIGMGIRLPKNYPNLWLARDLQLRALFESALEVGECCLVSYNCLVSPNLRQELRATQFFTAQHSYMYVHSMGFVSLTKSPILHLCEAASTSQRNYDLLKLTLIHGQIKMKVYLDDGELVAKKLNCIFQNAASDKPSKVSDLITRLVEIENAHNLAKNEKRNLLLHPHQESSIIDPFEFIKQNGSQELPSKTVSFPDRMTFIGEHIVKLPPQALFTCLFGSHSTLLDELHPVVQVRHRENVDWQTSADPDIVLEREFPIEFAFFSNKGGRFRMKQIVEHLQPDEFYSIKTIGGKFKVMYSPEFSFLGRFTITAIEGGQSKLTYYSTVNIEGRTFLSMLLRRLCTTFGKSSFGRLRRKVDEAAKIIGHNGKPLKAIYHYGKIRITDTPRAVALNILVTRLAIWDVIRLAFRGTLISVGRRLLVGLSHVFAFVSSLVRALSMHGLLLGVIVVLSFMNILLGARSTYHYWNGRHAKSMVKEVLQFEPMRMERAVYLKDIQDLIMQKAPSFNDTLCFQTFQNKSFVLNHHQALSWNRVYDEDLSHELALKLSNSLQEIALKRNELLVSLNMLNQMEEEIAKAEWRNWLTQELFKCEQVKHLDLLGSTPADMEGLDSYCDSCSQEMSFLLARS